MTRNQSKEIIALAKETVLREARALEALADQFDENMIPVIDLLLACQGHVLVSGAGTSRAMAERLAHLFSCSGRPALFISAADSLHGTAGAVTDKDVVYLISKGGHSAEVNQFAAIAKDRGAKVIAQTENPDSPLGKMSDAVYHIVTVGEVDPFDGLVAIGSSLVNGAAGDALCATMLLLTHYSFERFAKTHPGGEVGVKLAQRAEGNE